MTVLLLAFSARLLWFMRKLFPNTTVTEDSTHLMRRGMRTLRPGHSMISESYFSLCQYLCGTAAELMQADVPIVNLMHFDAGCDNPKQAKQL